ncbi:MAG TPA: C45 family peptidase [Caulobacteraceae bacterium]|nr:C45 family peptidase [Caulobacteraceae bacterium]
MQSTLVAGSPFERGRAHGAALKDHVRGHLDAWLEELEAAGVGEPRAYVRQMLDETDFASAIDTWCPELEAEVEGIAAGAQAPADLVFGLQLLDEEWAWRNRRQAKCSSFALIGDDGATIIGQNMDLGGYTDGHQALLRIAPGGDGVPEALVFTVAGMIGLMGVNAAGVAVCVNSLPQLPSSPAGVPVAFVLRRLLQTTSLAEAVELVGAIPHATNQHWLIAEAGAARSFEASCEGVVEYRAPDPRRILHTNHPLAAAGAPETEAARANSAARLVSLQARLGAGPMILDAAKGALSAFDDPRHPVCRLNRPDGRAPHITTGSIISVLRPAPAAVECWISFGPPSLGGYSRFGLERRGAFQAA